ncbi:MAG: trypsin-like peptidase domain-containing protein [Planctomycetes bacterium]|nr:trypsin-like peptidase domain-containing protein [Planctomycetota bacterium]
MTRLLLCVLLMLTACAVPESGHRSVSHARARAASVEILVGGHLTGSGWIADPEGWIVTASHGVIDVSGTLEVMSPTLGRRAAEVVAHDLGHDLALLRVKGGGGPYPVLPLADRIPDPGSHVFLFGSALYRRDLLLRSAVARAEETFEHLASTGDFVRSFLIHGTALPGSSGGAWCDTAGRVVGCQSGMVTQNSQSAGIAIAAPIDAIRHLLDVRTDVITASLGCGLENLVTQPAGFVARLPAGIDGVVTVPVPKTGPVHDAGITAETVIIKIDGVPVSRRGDLLHHVREQQPGETVSLTVVSPDAPRPRTVMLRLGRVGQRAGR